LLAAALDGKTDAELSAFKPEILCLAEVDDTRRGPQKRHRIVAYIRSHPEELRPFAWDPAKR
jgi:hypothetical protein